MDYTRYYLKNLDGETIDTCSTVLLQDAKFIFRQSDYKGKFIISWTDGIYHEKNVNL
jgi:hypothetical protein